MKTQILIDVNRLLNCEAIKTMWAYPQKENKSEERARKNAENFGFKQPETTKAKTLPPVRFLGV